MEQSEKMEREDYMDPQCPFCTDQYQKEPPVRSIPTARIIEKLDELLGRNDYTGAERLLLYWLEEARQGKDLRGEFQLCNELMGLSRKCGKRDAALENASRALELIEKLGIEDSVSAGTAFVNAATVYKAFGMAERAMPYFKKARDLYERNLKPDDPMLAGLYNNMALAETDLKRFGEARALYGKALGIVSSVQGSEPEAAVTCLNLANLVEAEKGLENGAEEIETLLRDAQKFMDTSTVTRDGNYAFYCEKCAPTFGYYGYFGYAEELTERAKQIYERN